MNSNRLKLSKRSIAASQITVHNNGSIIMCQCKYYTPLYHMRSDIKTSDLNTAWVNQGVKNKK